MITREEIIEVCNKLGLVEYHTLDDFRTWEVKNNIFKTRRHATVVVLSENPDDKITGNRLYFYNILKYNTRTDEFCMDCEDNFIAYRTKTGNNYIELYNKETFEKALVDIIKKIKNTEHDLKLQKIKKDFE